MARQFFLSILLIFVTINSCQKNFFAHSANVPVTVGGDLAVHPNEEVKVDYHVWYDPNPTHPDPSLPQAQLSIVAIEGQSTFFQVMVKAAEAQPEEFSFEYTDYPFGRFITKIGQVEQDADANIFWMIYKLNETADPNQPPTDDLLTPTGVDGIKVSDGEIYLFWRRTVDSNHSL